MIRSTKDWAKWEKLVDGGEQSIDGRVLTTKSDVDTGRSRRHTNFPVRENDQVILKVMAKLVSGTVKPAIDFFDSSGSVIKTEFFELTSHDWNQVIVRATAPRNATSCRVLCGTFSADIGEGKFHSPEITHKNSFQFNTFFKPEIKGLTNEGSFNYSRQDGRATVINGYCFFNLRIDFDGITDSPEGNLAITLPFECDDISTSGSSNHFAANIGIAENIPLPENYTQLIASVRAGNDFILLEALGDNQPFIRIQAEDLQTSGRVFISLSGFYEIKP